MRLIEKDYFWVENIQAIQTMEDLEIRIFGLLI